MWTIGLSIFVWICDTILEIFIRYYEAERGEYESISEEQKVAVFLVMSINVVAFIVWAFLIARKLF